MYFTIVWPGIITDSLWIKSTDALNSNFIGITTLHVSGSLSAHHQEFLAVHQLWYILCSFDEPFATRSRIELQSSSILHREVGRAKDLSASRYEYIRISWVMKIPHILLLRDSGLELVCIFWIILGNTDILLMPVISILITSLCLFAL
jgi:hypothetical protein